jgi:acyl-CoA oxidase
MLLDKQSAQSRLLPPLADAYAMHFATRLLMDKHVNNAPDLETMAAALKAVSSDNAMNVIDEARRVEGGHGYMADRARYGALRNDVDIFRTFEGDNTVLRLLVARNQLTEFGKQFKGASALKKAFKMASLAVGSKTSKLDLSKGSTRNLLDSGFHEEMFAKREKAMLLGVMAKIKKNIKSAGGFKQAGDLCQDDMIAYADAYAEKVMLEEFVKAVKAEKDPETKALLKDVCDLFAVNTMVKNAAWYIENGYMKPEKTKALAETREALNLKLRPHAVELVQAFAIPKELLFVPEQKAVAAPVQAAASRKKTVGLG